MYEGLLHMQQSFQQSPPGQDLINKPIIIAVLDSGIYHNHPKLKDMVIGCTSVVPGEGMDNASDDSENHGTFCAGIIWRYASRLRYGNSHVIKILNIKILSNNYASDSEVIHGLYNGFNAVLRWETNNNRSVDIITTSVGVSGGSFVSPEVDHLNKLLLEMSTKRVIMAAVSNQGRVRTETICYPATNDSVLGIGGIDNLGNLVPFSAQGEGVDFVFPAKDIVSTSRPPRAGENGLIHSVSELNEEEWWTQADGTSFAAPHCAVAVAIILVYCHKTIGADFRTKITRTDMIKRLFKEVQSHEKKAKDGYGFPKLSLLTSDLIKKIVEK